MKKLLAALLFAGIVAVPAVANDEVSVFSPAFRPSAKTFTMNADAFFQTGINKDGDASTDFGSGDWSVGNINMAYGLMDNLAITATVNPSVNRIWESGNPQIGVNFQAFTHEYIAIDVFGKYGISWTKNKNGDDETFNGRNDFDLGLKLSGRADKFSWSVTASADIFLKATDTEADVDTEYKSRVDFKINLSAMYDFNEKWSAIAMFDYQRAGKQEIGDHEMDGFDLNKTIGIGAVYSVNETFSIMPYVGYHFETSDGDDDDWADNSVRIGCKFGIKI